MTSETATPPPRPARALRLIGIAVVAGLLLLIALAAVPWQLLKGQIATRLADRFGAPVSIGSMTRQTGLSFHPTIEIRDLVVAQPRQAEIIRARRLAVRFAVLPVLVGRLRIESATLDGVTVRLARDAAGRWSFESDGKAGGGSGGQALEQLTVRNSRLILSDAKRHMTIDAGWSADARGLRLHGRGTHRGRPMTLRLDSGPVVRDRPWGFRIALASPLLRFQGQGRTDRPLAIGQMKATIAAWAGDARYLDDVIEAGLPGTQPVSLTATVRHDRPDWTISGLTGRIGRSPLAGDLTVRKREERTILDGSVRFAALDFADLASSAGRARAAARQRAIGPRVIPDTEIHFEKLARTDGTLRIHVARLIGEGPMYFRGVRTVMTMDHRLLTLTPLTISLPHGRMNGRMAVDHRTGDPKLSVNLTMTGARLEDLVGSNRIAGPIAGRLRVTGTGRTIRAALANAGGSIGLAGQGASVDRTLAIAASGDVLKAAGRAIGGSDGSRTSVRCVVAQLRLTPGRVDARRMLVDTEISRANGEGVIRLPSETVDLAFTGRAKDPGAIQLEAPIRLKGSLSKPDVQLVPESVRGKGAFAKAAAILKGLSTGNHRPVVTPIDCKALSADALK
ncbi:asmA family protein [Sphingomonas naphthae]|uniref:AsmA family protein n=1 Tax=Sphingomonas naphthae TaxID=1813468 RepID=A0ABY7TNF9_9SPHN|nr:asmA family protein [Sphingomonas naphthae]WCT74765.1 asmA family protein [Sphingomonas naphthae]